MVGINSVRTVKVKNEEEMNVMLNRLFPTEMKIKDKKHVERIKGNLSRLPDINVTRANDARLL